MDDSWLVKGCFLQPPQEDCLGGQDDRQPEQGGGSDGHQGGQEAAQGGEEVCRLQLSLDQSLHQTPARIREHAWLAPFPQEF